MRALVTGVTGFVGGHMAEHLIASGDVVVGLSHSGDWPAANNAPLGRQVRCESCDLARIEPAELAELLRKKQPEAIYHLAAQANPRASLDDPRGTWALNLGGTLTLLEAVRLSELSPRVLLVGTGVSYGNPAPEHLPVSESCPLRRTTRMPPARPPPTSSASSTT